jgi:hypothetical protein
MVVNRCWRWWLLTVVDDGRMGDVSRLSCEQPNLAAAGRGPSDVLNMPSILYPEMPLWLRWFQHVFYGSSSPEFNSPTMQFFFFTLYI